jgi:hypothetical protein
MASGGIGLDGLRIMIRVEGWSRLHGSREDVLELQQICLSHQRRNTCGVRSHSRLMCLQFPVEVKSDLSPQCALRMFPQPSSLKTACKC